MGKYKQAPCVPYFKIRVLARYMECHIDFSKFSVPWSSNIMAYNIKGWIVSESWLNFILAYFHLCFIRFKVELVKGKILSNLECPRKLIGSWSGPQVGTGKLVFTIRGDVLKSFRSKYSNVLIIKRFLADRVWYRKSHHLSKAKKMPFQALFVPKSLPVSHRAWSAQSLNWKKTQNHIFIQLLPKLWFSLWWLSSWWPWTQFRPRWMTEASKVRLDDLWDNQGITVDCSGWLFWQNYDTLSSWPMIIHLTAAN